MKSLTVFVSLTLLAITGTCLADDAKSLRDYQSEARAAVSAISVREAAKRLGDDDVVFVDVREAREIERHGKIEGALHVPRGFLEFVMDPKGPMHIDAFSAGKKLIFYCETDGRSALAAKLAKDMGIDEPVYLKGGYRAWARAGN